MGSRDAEPTAARRALAHALAEYLDRARVRDAVALWRLHFEGQGSLSVALNRYCRQVAERFGLPGKEAELHLKIFRALQLDPLLLPEDPLSLPPPEEDPTVPGQLAGGPLPRVSATGQGVGARLLQTFYAALEAQLARDLPAGLTPARLRRTLIRHAAVLPRAQRHPASLWWSGQVGVLDGDWPAGGAGTELVNVMYVTLAELVGPARADQCFTNAVRQLEASGDPVLDGVRDYL